jgi:hypothetical protein
MSDFLATALGLAFTLVVCLLALQAILSPWLRLRRAPATAGSHSNETLALNTTQQPRIQSAHQSTWSSDTV